MEQAPRLSELRNLTRLALTNDLIPAEIHLSPAVYNYLREKHPNGDGEGKETRLCLWQLVSNPTVTTGDFKLTLDSSVKLLRLREDAV